MAETDDAAEDVDDNVDDEATESTQKAARAHNLKKVGNVVCCTVLSISKEEENSYKCGSRDSCVCEALASLSTALQ